MKRNMVRFGMAVMTVLCSAMTAMAQEPAAASGDTSRGLGFIAAGIGFAIAAGLCGLSQAKVASAACEGMARNPSAYNRIQLALILGLAFIETLVIFTFVVVLIKVNP